MIKKLKDNNYRGLFVLINLLSFALIIAAAFVCQFVSYDKAKATQLDNNYTIEQTFPYYNGTNNLISQNVGYFPIFDVPFYFTSNTMFFDNNAIRINAPTSEDYRSSWFNVVSRSYNGFSYKPINTSFYQGGYGNINFTNVLNANTTYTFSFILFNIYPYNDNYYFDIGVDYTYSDITSWNGTSLYTYNSSVNPGTSAYYFTFTTPSTVSGSRIRFMYNNNFCISFFLTEGSNPLFYEESSSDVFSLGRSSSFNIYPNNSTSLFDSSSNFNLLSLNVIDGYYYSYLSELLYSSKSMTYIKFKHSGSTFYVPLVRSELNSSSFVGRYYYRNDNSLISYLDFTFSIPDNYTRTLSVLYYRNDGDTSYITLSSLDFYFSFVSSDDLNIYSYNQGYLDGSNNYKLTSSYQHEIQDAYNDGQTAGSLQHNNFLSLMSAVVNAPVSALLSAFDVEILGYNMKNLLASLLTISLIFFVIKFITGNAPDAPSVDVTETKKDRK